MLAGARLGAPLRPDAQPLARDALGALEVDPHQAVEIRHHWRVATLSPSVAPQRRALPLKASQQKEASWPHLTAPRASGTRSCPIFPVPPESLHRSSPASAQLPDLFLYDAERLWSHPSSNSPQGRGPERPTPPIARLNDVLYGGHASLSPSHLDALVRAEPMTELSLPTACPRCSALCSDTAIRAPGDLWNTICIVRAKLADGTLADTSENSAATPSFSKVASGDEWGRPFFFRFHCTECRQAFVLELAGDREPGATWRAEIDGLLTHNHNRSQ